MSIYISSINAYKVRISCSCLKLEVETPFSNWKKQHLVGCARRCRNLATIKSEKPISRKKQLGIIVIIVVAVMHATSVIEQHI